jgi:uncharacterized protein (DUF1330 family)
MKIWHTTALVIAVGLGLGFVATHGFAAHPKRAVYVVIEANEITDAPRYEAMKKTGPANIVEAKLVNGRYLARTENLTSLDGIAPKGIVIIAFDNAAKAKAYYDNTKEATAMRFEGTKSRAFLVEVCLVRGQLLPSC